MYYNTSTHIAIQVHILQYKYTYYNTITHITYRGELGKSEQGFSDETSRKKTTLKTKTYMGNIIKTEIQEIRYGLYWIVLVWNKDMGGIIRTRSWIFGPINFWEFTN